MQDKYLQSRIVLMSKKNNILVENNVDKIDDFVHIPDYSKCDKNGL